MTARFLWIISLLFTLILFAPTASLAGGIETPDEPSWILNAGGLGGVFLPYYLSDNRYLSPAGFAEDQVSNVNAITPVSFGGGFQLSFIGRIHTGYYLGLGLGGLYFTNPLSPSTIDIAAGVADLPGGSELYINSTYKTRHTYYVTAMFQMMLGRDYDIYLQAGPAYMRLKRDLVSIVGFPVGAGTKSFTLGAKKTGVIVILGAEKAFTSHFSIFAQYMFMGFPRIRFPEISPVNPLPSPIGDTLTSSVVVRAQILFLGLNVKFH